VEALPGLSKGKIMIKEPFLELNLLCGTKLFTYDLKKTIEHILTGCLKDSRSK